MRHFIQTRPKYKFRGFRPYEPLNPLGRWPKGDESEGSGEGQDQPGEGDSQGQSGQGQEASGQEPEIDFTPDPEGEDEEVRDSEEDESESEGESEGEEPEGDEGEFDGDFDGDEPEESEEEIETEAPAPAPEEFELPPLPARVATLPFFETRKKLILRQFPSWHDYVRTVADTSLRQWSGVYLASRTPGGGDDWTGVKNFETAVQMALGRGWPEGRKLLSDAMVLVAPKPEPYKAQVYDVAGAYPLVPLYVAGDPASMVEIGEEQIIARPVVRIDYSNAGNAHLDPESLMLRGAALLSAARDLESRGYSTELRVTIYHANYDGSGPAIYYSFVFKKAGQFLDLDRAAFAIAHPATLRRFGLALIEQHRDLEPTFRSGYGTIQDFQLDPTNKSVIYVPGPKGKETPQSARASVGKIFSDWLNSSRKPTKKAA